MNEALALTRLRTVNVREVLALPGSISERAAKQLSAASSELMRNISSILEDLVLSAVDKRTAADFNAVRQAVFPKYFEGIFAFSALARIVVPHHVIERLSSEFFCEMEADLRDQGLAAFGTEVRDQALFTVWTLRKISDICQRIGEVDLTESLKQSDGENCRNYAAYTVWTRFHLECLVKSMQHKRPLYPEVLEVILDGLRAAVDAYAWARRGLELRTPSAEPAVAPIEWDEEEQALLDEATHDMLGEPA